MPLNPLSLRVVVVQLSGVSLALDGIELVTLLNPVNTVGAEGLGDIAQVEAENLLDVLGELGVGMVETNRVLHVLVSVAVSDVAVKLDIGSGVATSRPVDTGSFSEDVEDSKTHGRNTILLVDLDEVCDVLIRGIGETGKGQESVAEVGGNIVTNLVGELGGEELSGVLCFGNDSGVPTVHESQATTLVVSSGKELGVGVLGDEFLEVSHDLVIHEDVVNVASGIIGVTGVVDAGSLDHDEVALLAVLSGVNEGLDSGLGHLEKRRLLLRVAVELVGHVAAGEQTKERHRQDTLLKNLIKVRLVGGIGIAFLDGPVNQADVIRAATSGSSGNVHLATATHHNVHNGTEGVRVTNLLSSDLGLRVTEKNVGAVASRSGMGDTRGGLGTIIVRVKWYFGEYEEWNLQSDQS
jgi:hypothetical protein